MRKPARKCKPRNHPRFAEPPGYLVRIVRGVSSDTRAKSCLLVTSNWRLYFFFRLMSQSISEWMFRPILVIL